MNVRYPNLHAGGFESHTRTPHVEMFDEAKAKILGQHLSGYPLLAYLTACIQNDDVASLKIAVQEMGSRSLESTSMNSRDLHNQHQFDGLLAGNHLALAEAMVSILHTAQLQGIDGKPIWIQQESLSSRSIYLSPEMRSCLVESGFAMIEWLKKDKDYSLCTTECSDIDPGDLAKYDIFCSTQCAVSSLAAMVGDVPLYLASTTLTPLAKFPMRLGMTIKPVDVLEYGNKIFSFKMDELMEGEFEPSSLAVSPSLLAFTFGHADLFRQAQEHEQESQVATAYFVGLAVNLNFDIFKWTSSQKHLPIKDCLRELIDYALQKPEHTERFKAMVEEIVPHLFCGKYQSYREIILENQPWIKDELWNKCGTVACYQCDPKMVDYFVEKFNFPEFADNQTWFNAKHPIGLLINGVSEYIARFLVHNPAPAAGSLGPKVVPVAHAPDETLLLILQEMKRQHCLHQAIGAVYQETGETLGHFSSSNGFVKSLAFLCANGLDVEARTHAGKTLLDVASKKKKNDIINITRSASAMYEANKVMQELCPEM